MTTAQAFDLLVKAVRSIRTDADTHDALRQALTILREAAQPEAGA